ncbi:oxygenase MpaB family protein, partial [Streptomyces sp. T-3]|nr:oxygenase MpaB family protein [Streptomyces sp. T-3]
MGRYTRLREIRRMDPARDFERIHKLISQYEFPWDYTQGIGIAFIRDYGVPRISQLLDHTQEFEKAGQKRYDDTILFAHEMAQDGFDSERSRAAARHLNRIHGKYNIANEDFLYVLATTVVGPKRWIDRFGWRPLCANEAEALALVGHKMAQLMHIEGAPSTYGAFEKLMDDYEREMFAYHPANRRVATATFRVTASWYPRLLRPVMARFSLALLDEPLLTALGFKPQPRWVRRLAVGAVRARSQFVRLLPAR